MENPHASPFPRPPQHGFRSMGLLHDPPALLATVCACARQLGMRAIVVTGGDTGLERAAIQLSARMDGKDFQSAFKKQPFGCGQAPKEGCT